MTPQKNMYKKNNSRTMSLCGPSILANPHIHKHHTKEFSLFIQRLLYVEGISLRKCAIPINHF